jgi:hypothetical protein
MLTAMRRASSAVNTLGLPRFVFVLPRVPLSMNPNFLDRLLEPARLAIAACRLSVLPEGLVDYVVADDFLDLRQAAL